MTTPNESIPEGSITVFDKLKDRVFVERCAGGMVFNWTRRGVGFGQLTMIAKRGKLIVDTECMDAEFCAQIVKQAIEEATNY